MITICVSWTLAYRRPHHWVREEVIWEPPTSPPTPIVWSVGREDAPGRIRIESYWGSISLIGVFQVKSMQQVAKLLPPWAQYLQQRVASDVANYDLNAPSVVRVRSRGHARRWQAAVSGPSTPRISRFRCSRGHPSECASRLRRGASRSPRLSTRPARRPIHAPFPVTGPGARPVGGPSPGGGRIMTARTRLGA